MRTAPFYGSQTVTTGVVQVTGSSEKLERGLLVTCYNCVGTVFLGYNALVNSGNGYPLTSGQQVVFPLIDPALLYATASTGNNVLRFMGL